MTKPCRITKQGIWQYGNFRGRDRSINMFARSHTNPSEDVKNIFMLSKHQTHTGGLNLNTQKIMNDSYVTKLEL
jgi:hypothetical protein